MKDTRTSKIILSTDVRANPDHHAQPILTCKSNEARQVGIAAWRIGYDARVRANVHARGRVVLCCVV